MLPIASSQCIWSSVSSTNIALTRRLSVRKLSAMSEYFCTHFHTATWLLFLTSDSDLAASRKLLELKYMYSAYLTIAGSVLLRFMGNDS